MQSWKIHAIHVANFQLSLAKNLNSMNMVYIIEGTNGMCYSAVMKKSFGLQVNRVCEYDRKQWRFQFEN